jgi:hypothetical protein
VWEATRKSFLRARERSPFVRHQLEGSGLTALDAVTDPAARLRLRSVEKGDLLADQEG